ncbi:MAG: SidA/IucD/PvdA family monooxygenase, partial [Thermomicrobiales bacterium]|nr:SidA/IucD/PvdA family monooxygenase [Thermomicrobiales bacterium]
PLSRSIYLDYARWFQQQKGIKPREVVIESLDQMDGSDRRFRARLAGGDSILAGRVVLALGFQYFKHVPDDLANRFPDGYAAHTCDAVNFSDAEGQRFLIVGGRQSAFEWAALLGEHGAKAVHVSHRHDTPAFTPSDWSWTTPMLETMVEDPAWFRQLSPAQKQEISQRMWGEGRLKLEPWLAPRITNERITVWPRSQITHSEQAANGDLLVSLDSGARLAVDRVILATGYKVDMARVPLFARSGMLSRLRTRSGFPVLDEHFQSSIPGLFITSMPASQDFGPFFGFTVSVRTSARLIAAGLSA